MILLSSDPLLTQWEPILQVLGINSSLCPFCKGNKTRQPNQPVGIYMGVSLNGGTPKTPQNDDF